MEYQIYITDTIGWPISARYVRQELARYQGQPCHVFINSFGGAVSDALEIRQMFLDHGDVTCHVHGMTASAATILAMGAKKIVMGKFALMLIHQVSSWVDTWGQMNADDLASAIEELQKGMADLQKIDQVVANLYAARTGKTAAEMAALMKDGQWLSADECLGLGLVDELTEADQPSVLTDDLKTRILACGYSVPAVAAKPAAKKTLVQKIKDIFSAPTASTTSAPADAPVASAVSPDQPQEPKNITNMPNKFVALCALLAVAELAAGEDGKYSLTAEQLTALESELAALQAAKKTAEDQVSALQEEKASLAEQVENLKAADGADDDSVVETPAADRIDNPVAAAKASYETLKNII